MARRQGTMARKGGVSGRRSHNSADAADHASLETVDRAARLLSALAATSRESTLVDIAARTRLSKPTAFRILATLVADGLAVQNEQTSAYALGVVPLQLGSAVLRDISIRERARPVMHSISTHVNETVVLSVREGDWRFNVDSVEASNAIGQTQQIGLPIPLYAGAASRVLLAGLADKDLDAYLNRTILTAFSETTFTNRGRLKVEIDRIRSEGFATSSAEFTPGGHAVACAIRGTDGTAIAALHVSIPRSRASDSLIAQCIEKLQAGTAAIAAGLPKASRIRDPAE